MNDNFSITIDCKCIIEWMADRKKLPKEWPKKHKSVQLKMKKILEKQMPEKELEEYINDFKETFNFGNVNQICKKLLLTNHAKDKNFFGSYNSPLVKEWLALKELFQNENIHIIDIGKFLSQTNSFEIPSIKKNISSLENEIKDLNQKITDFRSAIKGTERDYQHHCEKLGIKGEELEKEVLGLTSEIPVLLEKIMIKMKDEKTKQILKYYYDFTKYINGKQDQEKINLKLLDYLNSEEDDTLDYYEDKKFGRQVSEDLKQFNAKNFIEEEIKKIVPSNLNEIDWNININYDFAQIDTLNQPMNEQKNDEEIDWGDFYEKPVIVDQEKTEEKIKIEIIEESNQKDKDEWVIIDPDNELMKKDYRKDTLLSNRDTRNEIIANLFELLFFLKQRVYETKSFSSNSLLQAYDHSTDSALFELNSEKIESFISHINEIINQITSTKIMSLFLLKDQAKARERTVEGLKNYKLNKKKYEETILSYEKKNEELALILSENKLKHKKIIEETHIAKDELEKIMKDLIKRDVFITGLQK